MGYASSDSLETSFVDGETSIWIKSGGRPSQHKPGANSPLLLSSLEGCLLPSKRFSGFVAFPVSDGGIQLPKCNRFGLEKGHFGSEYSLRGILDLG